MEILCVICTASSDLAIVSNAARQEANDLILLKTASGYVERIQRPGSKPYIEDWHCLHRIRPGRLLMETMPSLSVTLKKSARVIRSNNNKRNSEVIGLQKSYEGSGENIATTPSKVTTPQKGHESRALELAAIQVEPVIAAKRSGIRLKVPGSVRGGWKLGLPVIVPVPPVAWTSNQDSDLVPENNGIGYKMRLPDCPRQYKTADL
ncbi:uncharacterized protein ASPGLDRAFT_25925 [Aspergillus glaucus CBS 516.65]|uniref:Uncharacterized protein n=1 Tax=Aspergillus glaucus CBS 516.65 TaxID=1160497 RepID=A0A1L9VIK3_ASPGL|nr:hypothetical protein ASPGLDRAFT_25925 [Aspergillus glaucus CBS 516.65]OJJ83712.1 hypothetical protein ASPGLDRAFT_25925 [Aspergillus glaucus CBS 516.65]